MTTRELQKQRRKEEIVAAAKVLFLKHGIQQVQLQDIAKEVGIGIATFYRYFAKKEHIILAVNNVITKEITDRVEKITATNKSAYDQMELILDYYVELTEDPEHQFVKFVKAFENYKPELIDFPAEYEKYLDVRLALAYHLISVADRGVADQSLRHDIDLSFTIITMVHNISSFMTETTLKEHDPNLPVELNAKKQIELTKEMFLYYIRPTQV